MRATSAILLCLLGAATAGCTEDRASSLSHDGAPLSVDAPRSVSVDVPADSPERPSDDDAGAPAVDAEPDRSRASDESGCDTIGVGNATALAHAPDGAWLAVGNDIGFLSIIRRTDAAVLLTTHVADAPITSVTVSSDGTLLLVVAGTRVKVVERARGAVVAQWSPPPQEGLTPGRSAAFTPDATAFVIGTYNARNNSNGLEFRRTADGARLSHLLVGPGSAMPDALTVSPDGSVVAFSAFAFPLTAPGDAGLFTHREVWGVDLRTGKELWRLPDARGPIAFSADSRLVASRGLEDDVVEIWNLADRRRLRRIASGRAEGIAFVNGETMAVAGEGLSLFRVADGTFLRRLEPGRAPLSVSASGDELVSAAGTTVGFWRPRDGFASRTLDGPSSTIRNLSISPDGTLLALAEESGIRIWDVGGKRQRAFFPERVAWFGGVAFSPDGQRLAVAADDAVKLLDAIDGRTLWTALPPRGQVPSVVAFSADGRHVAAGMGDWTALVLDANTGAVTRSLGTPAPDALMGQLLLARTPVAFSPAGEILAVGGETSALFRLSDGATVRPLGPALDLAFSPDGQLLALQTPTHLAITRASDGGELRAVPHPEPHVIPPGLAFSADGRLLASSTTRLIDSTHTGVVRLVTVSSGETSVVGDTPLGQWSSIVFSPTTDSFAAILGSSLVRFICGHRDAAGGPCTRTNLGADQFQRQR